MKIYFKNKNLITLILFLNFDYVLQLPNIPK